MDREAAGTTVPADGGGETNHVAASGPSDQVGAAAQGAKCPPKMFSEEAEAASVPPLPAESPSDQDGRDGGGALAVPGGDRDDASDGDDEVNTDVEESDEDVPAGPIDPERCVANGPGISGAEAGAPVNVIIVARDSNNHRVREGGAHVFVCVEPTGPGARDAEPIEAKVTDHGNGTYTAQYAVPSKGNYELSIEVNGEPIGASPFPVFFSAAGKDTGTGGTGEGATPPPSVSQLGTEAQAAPTGVAINMLPNLSNSTLSFSMGPQAAQLGVIFPAVDDAQLARTVLVGGLSPFATPEALQAVFALQNRVRSINFAGASRAFAFIEFHTQAEAEAAVRMTGVTLLGQALRVESALAARNAAQGAPSVGGPAAAASPFLALQAQQVQVYQMMQVQQAALARQVAQLRAAQSRADDAARKAGGDARGAALAAAEHLSRKIGNDRAEKDAGRGRDRAEREERDRGRDRRDRDRDRDRRDRDKDSRRYRSRSRDRGRYGSRRDDERRHRDRRSRSRDRSDRRRDRRHRSRSRDRSRERRRHRSRSAEADGRRGVKDMEVERGPPEEHGRKASPAVSKPPPTPEDELEALLMELDG